MLSGDGTDVVLSAQQFTALVAAIVVVMGLGGWLIKRLLSGYLERIEAHMKLGHEHSNRLQIHEGRLINLEGDVHDHEIRIRGLERPRP